MNFLTPDTQYVFYKGLLILLSYSDTFSKFPTLCVPIL